MRDHFKTFTANVRPSGGNVIILLLLAVVLLPILLIIAAIAIFFFVIRLVFQAIFAILRPKPAYTPQPFDDDQGRRNVRVRHIENLAVTQESQPAQPTQAAQPAQHGES